MIQLLCGATQYIISAYRQKKAIFVQATYKAGAEFVSTLWELLFQKQNMNWYSLSLIGSNEFF